MANEMLRGGCLCRAVTYEVTAPFLRFAHCHCSRCRKATGSSHASNLYVPPDQFTWTRGKESVVRFDLPTARGFATTFCASCGTPLPHHTRSHSEIVVPAGSLDAEPSTLPEVHIFWGSQPRWSCRNDELPQFDEYSDNW